MSKKYYITTPIYYVNDIPHIGHAYTTLACDVLARFHRLAGYDVKFLTGTDEHGQKVEKSAIAKGIDPQSFTDQVSESFRNLGNVMNFSNDDFIRTTEVRHKAGAQALWNKLMENDEIYLGKYDGWYSVRDEAFYAESEIIDGKAPTGSPVEWMEEPSYFFKLSKWQDRLLEFYEQNPDFIKPASRRNEVVSFVKGGLNDLSVSRTTCKWGVPVPGNEEHVMYVWLDALSNYISALGYPDEKYKDYWPADVHVVGKDIIRFHAVYWPAFLMAANIAPPKTIMSHGWWTNEGEKISKSVGNVIDPIGLVEEFGLDQTRWFLMREVIFGNDGDFSRERMKMRINGELANKIGNLVQRTLGFIAKQCEGMNDGKIYVPMPSARDADYSHKNEEFKNTAYTNPALVSCSELYNELKIDMANQGISLALDKIMNLVDQTNAYFNDAAPWNIDTKTEFEKQQLVLYTTLELIRNIALFLQPFMPDAANNILDQLCIPQPKSTPELESSGIPNMRNFGIIGREFALEPGHKLQKPPAVFPRIQ